MSRKQPNGLKAKTAAVPTALRGIETQASTSDATKQRMGTFMATGIIRALGIVLLVVSMGAYFQIVPLTLVFIGGYLGVQPGASYGEMDTLIWAMTGIAVIIPMVWAFIKWVKYVWVRFIIRPISLIPSRLAK